MSFAFTANPHITRSLRPSSHPPIPSIAAPQNRSNTYRHHHRQKISHPISTMSKRTFACVNILDVAPQKYSLEVDLNRYEMTWYPGIRPQKEWAERTEPRKRRRRNNSWVPTIKRRVVGFRERRARRGLLRPLPIRVRTEHRRVMKSRHRRLHPWRSSVYQILLQNIRPGSGQRGTPSSDYSLMLQS
jgi:hypothetical protein